MLALILALVSAIVVPPKPSTYVTDKAGVLDPSRVKAVNQKLAQFERVTSDQILVYVDQRLPPETTIEQFANECMHQWGVGQKGKDNGAVLFLFTGDRKMRIEVGYGLEAVLTDAMAKRITSTIVKPRLVAADYNGAVEQGVDSILSAARGEENKGTGRTVHEARKPIEAARSESFAAAAAPCGVMVLFGIVIVGIIVLIAKRGIRGGGGATYINTTDSTSGSSTSFTDTSSSSSDSSSSSSSDSGFDGGGGDSGGGGASDSW